MALASIHPPVSGPGFGLADHLRQRSTLVLMSLGVLAVLIHASFRFPLNLPGHHGLEWMALLMFARLGSSFRWAAGVAAVGAALATMVPALGFHNPLTPLYYLVPAIALDALWLLLPARWHASVPALVAMASVAFLTKPLVQLAGMVTGVMPVKAGFSLPYVMASHFLFALCGGVVAALIWQRMSDRAAGR